MSETNKIDILALTDECERREAVMAVAVEIQKEFDDVGYSVNSETAHHDIERVAFEKVGAYNRTRPYQGGERMWHFVEFTPKNTPVLILKFCMDSNKNVLDDLRRTKDII